MSYSYITDNTATNVASGPVRKAVIQVNAALTGNIKVIDGTTGTTADVATITNPTVGTRYEYFNLADGFRVIASTSCDITASAVQSMGR